MPLQVIANAGRVSGAEARHQFVRESSLDRLDQAAIDKAGYAPGIALIQDLIRFGGAQYGASQSGGIAVRQASQEPDFYPTIHPSSLVGVRS